PSLKSFLMEHTDQINNIQFWYHYSQVAIHRVFQVSLLISKKQFAKALNTLENITYSHIRHGYREFLEIYISFFRLQLAKETLQGDLKILKLEFEEARSKLNYPFLTDEYFECYF
ncbi:MAG: hypothetical protein ACO29U_09825, partial [Crocinitomicaceae bacterium]